MGSLPVTTTSRHLVRLSVLAILACALVYVVALGTRWGLHADERAFPSGIGGVTWEHAHAALRRAVDPIHVATVVLAAGYAACVGVGLVALVAHYPSDVVGGYLVAGAWAAAMAAIALAWRERGGPAPARVPLPSAGTAIALLGLAVVAAALLLVPA